MENKRVAIITATNNCLEDLMVTSNSINSLNPKKISWIVVDNCSRDGTANFIRESKLIDKYLIEKDSGIYDAWNKAIDLAGNCKWIIFIGAGDVVDKRWINFLYVADHDLHILYSDLIIFNNKKKIIKKSLDFDKAYKDLEFYMSFPHPGMAHNRNLFSDKNFDTRYKIISDWIFLNSIPNLKGKYIKGYIQASFKIGGVSTSWKSKYNLYNEIKRYYESRLINLPLSFKLKKIIISTLIKVKIV